MAQLVTETVLCIEEQGRKHSRYKTSWTFTQIQLGARTRSLKIGLSFMFNSFMFVLVSLVSTVSFQHIYVYISRISCKWGRCQVLARLIQSPRPVRHQCGHSPCRHLKLESTETWKIQFEVRHWTVHSVCFSHLM